MVSFSAESFVFQLLSRNIKIKIYRNVILPVVLYERETWSVTFREECRLKIFENRMLRRIFGPKRDEVTMEWRRLQNEELYDFYSSPNGIWVIKIKKKETSGACGTYMRWERCVKSLMGRPEGKRPLGRPRHRLVDNALKLVIKMDLKKVV